ncbi:MAG: DUF134 domain-containing protein [Candidatus Saganbacteria bacterium]|nr:DUF134 domain-containing protein [Candidatus Saganbacteria bacterium]
MRPKKTRHIKCDKDFRFFKPQCKTRKEVREIIITLDEFEAIRLYDFEGLEQERAAKRMKISRPTFSRILSSARKKIARGLVKLEALKIEGGCCSFGK